MFPLDGLVTEHGGSVRVPDAPHTLLMMLGDLTGLPAHAQVTSRIVTFTKRRYLWETEPQGVLGAKPYTQRLDHFDYRYQSGPNAGWCNKCERVTDTDGWACLRYLWLVPCYHCESCNRDFFVSNVNDLWHECLEAK
jgi:hypothetical protein